MCKIQLMKTETPYWWTAKRTHQCLIRAHYTVGINTKNAGFQPMFGSDMDKPNRWFKILNQIW